MTSSNQSEQRCHYCRRKYMPTKRYIQKYCQSACRVAACNERKGRAHPKENRATRSRRLKDRGRTPSAVQHSEAAPNNREILAALVLLAERITGLEQQQRQVLELLERLT